MGGPATIIKKAMSNKMAEQPKVQSQMNAPQPDNSVAGPTTVETAYDEKKRRGRKATILTSTVGVSDQADILKKTLLGG